MPKASKKTKKELYALVSDEIMRARVEIAQKLPEKEGRIVDDILFYLNIKCPQKAIDYFKD